MRKHLLEALVFAAGVILAMNVAQCTRHYQHKTPSHAVAGTR